MFRAFTLLVYSYECEYRNNDITGEKKKPVFREVNQILFHLRHRNFITDICK